MLLKPGAQRGWYHGRKPQFREFQSLFAGTGTKVTATIDANGQAGVQPSVGKVTATANTVAGSRYTVTASGGRRDSPASFSLTNNPGVPASVTVGSGSNQAATVGTAFTSPLLVVVKDSYGNLVLPGTSVTFAVSPAANGASATLSSSTAMTGSNGQASLTATANAFAGSYTVTASVRGPDRPASA